MRVVVFSPIRYRLTGATRSPINTCVDGRRNYPHAMNPFTFTLSTFPPLFTSTVPAHPWPLSHIPVLHGTHTSCITCFTALVLPCTSKLRSSAADRRNLNTRTANRPRSATLDRRYASSLRLKAVPHSVTIRLHRKPKGINTCAFSTP